MVMACLDDILYKSTTMSAQNHFPRTFFRFDVVISNTHLYRSKQQW